MRTKRFLDRQTSSSLTAIALLLTMLVPSLVPAFASADALTERSITLSNAVANTANVTYDVSFKVSSAGAGAYVIDFCSNSPAVNSACTLPAGFSTTGVATSTANTTVTPVVGNRAVKVVQTVAGSGTATVTLTGIHNPSAANTDSTGLYGRILTYADSTAADGYTSATTVGSPVDTGSVALSITDNIGVSAAVRESLTFCVASQTITANCGDASTHPPSIVLGDGTGLNATTVSEGNLFTQISTNAASGAVIRLKSNATNCGGLLRAGATSVCNIGPATTGGFDFGEAKFGVKTGTATGQSGTLQPVDGSGYNASTYLMNFAGNNATGVTSTYGDPFLDSDSLPVDNQNMQLTFGASMSNTTPAGNYSASLSMIAAGKY